ncbi:MAG: ABC transporter permease [Christensenellaceae bacterium]
MKQFSTVYQFELFNYIKRKSYIAVTIVLVAIVAVVLCIPVLQATFADGGNAEAAPDNAHIAFVDETGSDASGFLNDALSEQGYALEAVTGTQEELAQLVEDGVYDSALILTGPLSYTRIVQNIGLHDYFDDVFSGVLKAKYQQDTLLGLGVPQDTLSEMNSAEVTPNIVTTASGKDQNQTFFYTYVLTFALYMVILIYGQFVASSVATEKSSRAMELLITSADPKSLIFGKVLGTGTAGLLQFALIFVTGFVMYNINADYYVGNLIVQSIFAMPLSMLLYTILFLVLGFFIYAFLYAALGSLVSRMEDLGTTTQPVTFLFIIAFIVVIFSMNSSQVENPALVICSFIPFTSPMAMFTRISMGNPAPFEIVISVVILIVSTIAIGFLATGIYRLGVLMYGKPPKLKELIGTLKKQKS